MLAASDLNKVSMLMFSSPDVSINGHSKVLDNSNPSSKLTTLYFSKSHLFPIIILHAFKGAELI
jgi:hypothetical protein